MSLENTKRALEDFCNNFRDVFYIRVYSKYINSQENKRKCEESYNSLYSELNDIIHKANINLANAQYQEMVVKTKLECALEELHNNSDEYERASMVEVERTREELNLAICKKKQAECELKELENKMITLNQIWDYYVNQLNQTQKIINDSYEDFTKLYCNLLEKINATISIILKMITDLYEENNIEYNSNYKYTSNVFRRIKDDTFNYTNKNIIGAASNYRRLNVPCDKNKYGEIKGTWNTDRSSYSLDDNFVPSYKNPQGHTVGQIKEVLKKDFNITLGEIPYLDGVVDLSSISVANISTNDFVLKTTGIDPEKYELMEPVEKLELLKLIFNKKNRLKNFESADEILAEKHVYIPGLGKNYTADELKCWRCDASHPFTYDEQLEKGLNLVPSIIHGNLSHTGTVGALNSAGRYVNGRKDDAPIKYAVDESETIISIRELERNSKNKRQN